MKHKFMKIKISGLHCKACELLSEDKLSSLPRIKRVKVNHNKGEAEIEYEGESPDKNQLKEVLLKIGYDLVDEQGPKEKIKINKWLDLFWAIIITGILAFIFVQSGWLNLQNYMNPEALSLGGILLMGLIAGVSTCMALIGGIVMAFATNYVQKNPNISKTKKFLPHIYFNLGRVAGFFILGGLLGSIGSILKISILANAWLTLLIGLLIIVIGLQILNVFPFFEKFSLSLPKSLGKKIKNHNSESDPLGIMATGALTFFLPCGFTQSMQIYALSTGSFLQGAIIMFVFAVGTSVGLLGLGGAVSNIKGKKTSLLFKVAGLIIILFGIFNILNAQQVFRLHSGDMLQIDKITESFQEEDLQIIKMEQASRGYIPNTLEVKVNKPVRWIINSSNPYSCASSLVVPSLSVNRRLEAGENIIEFLPTQTGEIRFACSMGMYTGVIRVID